MKILHYFIVVATTFWSGTSFGLPTCETAGAIIIDSIKANRVTGGTRPVDRLKAIADRFVTTEIQPLVDAEKNLQDQIQKAEELGNALSSTPTNMIFVHFSTFNFGNDADESRPLLVFVDTLEKGIRNRGATLLPIYVVYSRSFFDRHSLWAKNNIFDPFAEIQIDANRIVAIGNRNGVPRWHADEDKKAIRTLNKDLKCVCDGKQLPDCWNKSE